MNNSRTDSHDGFLTDRQLDWLGEQLIAAGRDRKLVLLTMYVPAHANRQPRPRLAYQAGPGADPPL